MPFAGASQAMPQPPQLAGSERVSMQESPHAVKPLSHVKPQAPTLHVALPCSGAGQTWPQAPQCAAVLDTSTQAPPQFTLPSAHSSLQAPLEHTRPGAQAVMQLPQW